MKGVLSTLTAGLVARVNLIGDGLGEQRLPIASGVLHRRSYFYVGGTYGQTSGTFVSGSDVVISSGQMYVEHLVPSAVTQKLPIVIIPGNGAYFYDFECRNAMINALHSGMTGTNFLNTPDGRIGWADYFMAQGYEVCSLFREYGYSVVN